MHFEEKVTIDLALEYSNQDPRRLNVYRKVPGERSRLYTRLTLTVRRAQREVPQCRNESIQ